MKLSRWIVIGLALFLGLMVWYAMIRPPEMALPSGHNLRSWQESDATPGYPLAKSTGEEEQTVRFDHRVGTLTPYERFLVPTASRFDFPLGSANGAFSYNAQPYWEMNEKRGGHHTGDDLNGIGGMNTDLGDPVYAIGNGRVVYAGVPSRGWGKIIILMHRLPDGRFIESLYAHLHKISQPVGALISRGQKIGEVGGANGVYLAHLHFELRESDGVEIGRGYTFLPGTRLNPTEFIQARRDASGISPSILMAVRQSERPDNPQLPSMDAESAARFAEFMSQEEE